MEIYQALILGIVQGITELLPISSSAHLNIIPWMFGWINQPGFAEAFNGFDVALHFGTLLAIIMVFFKDWIELIKGGFKYAVKKEKTVQGRMFWYIVLATIPGGIIGFLLDHFCQNMLNRPIIIAIALMVMGIVLYFVDKNSKNKVKYEEMTLKQTFLIGLSQALAFIPGVSRSGVTITTARAMGVTREAATKYSFLLSTPIVFAATVLKFKDFVFSVLSSVMTDDVNQRTDLSRFRSLGGTIFMTVIVIAGPLFLYKDNQPVPSHFLIMSAICAVIGLICLMFTSHWCKERIITEPVVEKKEKLNYFQVIKDITKNKALLGVMLSSFIGIVGAGMVNGLNTYLFRDYFGNVAIMAVSGMLSVLWSLIAFVGTKFVAKKFGKKEWIMYSATFSVVVYAILFFFPIENPILFIIINGICYLGVSGFQVLVWALVNDAIDYQELQTGKRNEGIVYSAYTFFRKLANAVSGSMSSFALAIAGFQVNEAVQNEAFSGHLWKTYTGLYVVGYLLAVLVLKFIYPLTKEKTAEMLQDLADKRNATTAE